MREGEVILETVRDVALCALVTVGVVAFCLLGRAAAMGKDVSR